MKLQISVLVDSFVSDRRMHRIWRRVKTRSHLFFDVCRYREVAIHHDAQVTDAGRRHDIDVANVDWLWVDVLDSPSCRAPEELSLRGIETQTIEPHL